MTGYNDHNHPPVSVALDDAAAELLSAMLDAFESRLEDQSLSASEATAMIHFLRETGSLGAIVANPKETPDV